MIYPHDKPSTVDPAGPTEKRVGDAMHRLLDRPLTSADLREAALHVGQPLATPDKDRTRVLAFRLCGETFALASSDVARVTHPARVHKIPHRTNQILRGLCNIEGELLLCVSLESLLGLSTAESGSPDSADSDHTSSDRRMIVLGEEGRRWAFDVDAVIGITPIDTARSKPPPLTVQQSQHGFTDSLVSVGDSLAALLDSQRVLRGLKAALS